MIFTKYNQINNDALIKEFNGLCALRENISLCENDFIRVPIIFHSSKSELVLEKIPTVSPNYDHMQKLGRGLAKIHKVVQPQFGFYENNYIGKNPQKNVLMEDWGEFFYTYRLEEQVKLIKDKSIKKEFSSILRKHKNKIIDFLNIHTDHASLIHGDLWQGNVLYSNEEIFLIDPAVYYADSEADLAMTELFGGFSEPFYKAYSKVRPLSSAYEDKKMIYNLYHYLNHYNIFGSSYLDPCFSGFAFIQKL